MPYVESAGGKLHYEIFDLVAPWETRRETIIFHHGIGADPGVWTEWLPALMDRYRVVRFDMRGYGRSHIPPADFNWSLDLMCNDILAVADAAGAERAHLVGESIGGTIALCCAIKNPARVATLTISNGAHLGASILRVNEWRRQIDEQGIKAWSDQFMKDRFYEGALEEPKRAWYARRQEEWTRDSILNTLAVLVGTDLRPRLPELRCPVLLMHGDSSPFIPAGILTDLHKCIPGSRLQIFAHARHGLPFSHAKQCARTLREFLDSSA
ncbi:MAG: alpha/beta hydrolase [Betaproteobacteria bacterium]|nr:alpha/beta hydrolase [Betaproteobacteria bacterium]